MGQSFIIHIGWPSRDLSPNGRPNRWRKAAALRAAKGEGFIETVRAMPRDWIKPERVRVTIAVRPPVKRRRDDDNLVSSAKGYLDGIAQRIGIDDSNFELAPIVWEDAARPGRLLIEIEALP